MKSKIESRSMLSRKIALMGSVFSFTSIIILFFALLGFLNPAYAQSGLSGVVPEGSSSVQIINTTSNKVIFYLESRHTDREEIELPAKTKLTYRVNGAGWYNFEIYTNGQGGVEYGLDTGTRYKIFWDTDTEKFDLRKSG